jgi:1,2-diacylglycerol 3-alpha-glucosyltransferase
MDNKLSVCLLNDSFPPLIDGVSNVVYNYAKIIQDKYGSALVATPSYPDVVDDYSFPVVRYPSINTTKKYGYRAGFPFSISMVKELGQYDFDIIHSHCPFASTTLARNMRTTINLPIVMTYHTKFDIDIAKAVKLELFQSAALKFMLANIEACDEVWVVSRGSGENLKSLGYEGDYIVMDNGVEFPQGKASQEEIAEISRLHALREDVPVFLFVGRMMWYKGIRIILDGLSKVKSQGMRFQMLFVGAGTDYDEITKYAATLGLSNDCIFTGAVRDRQKLRAYFSRADMFLFPSTFDNRPIVVLEAAACGLPSMLIRGSSSAENVTEGHNSMLIEENADSLAIAVAEVIKNPGLAKKMGSLAMDELYISWDEAVARAVERYERVIENYRSKNHGTYKLNRLSSLVSRYVNK